MPVYKYRSIGDMSRATRQTQATFHPNGLRVIDENVLDEVVERVVRAFSPRRIVVFGSVARGQAGPDSDLDLFVEMESNLRPADRAIAIRGVLRGLHVPMDIFVYTPAEVASARTKFGNLMSYVDAEGRILYEA